MPTPIITPGFLHDSSCLRLNLNLSQLPPKHNPTIPILKVVGPLVEKKKKRKSCRTKSPFKNKSMNPAHGSHRAHGLYRSGLKKNKVMQFVYLFLLSIEPVWYPVIHPNSKSLVFFFFFDNRKFWLIIKLISILWLDSNWKLEWTWCYCTTWESSISHWF